MVDVYWIACAVTIRVAMCCISNADFGAKGKVGLACWMRKFA